MATLTSRLVISLSDRVSGPARGITNSLRSMHKAANAMPLVYAGRQASRAGQHFMRAGASALTAGYAFRSIVEPTREFNEAIWGTTAALMGNTKALKPAQKQAEEMRETALELSKAYGVMPEVFAKAGMEATKMGLNHKKASAVMAAAGKVWISDKDVDPSAMAKSLGTYGIIYGAPDDDEAYAKVTNQRASTLALAGAKTRTSASGIEEGLRNYMGVHGAFGGRFEDAVALVAMGSQVGLMEKETGTSLKTLTTRFLRMPPEGRAAMAGAGIDINRFMDFSAVDPYRATGQLIQLFPGQFKKGARGNVLKHLEKAQRSGKLKDPAIIGDVLKLLEKQGLKFAGAEDRDIALQKIAAVMHGAGGNFDPLAFFGEVSKAVKDGRAGPGILGLLGEPKRLHQYLALNHVIEDTVALRDELLSDQGKFLDLVAAGYSESDAGRIVAMEAAWRRFYLALLKSGGMQAAVKNLEWFANWLADSPKWAKNAIGGLLALGAVALPLGFALRGLASAGKALYGLGAGVLGMLFGGGAAGAATTASGRMIAGMSAAGAAAGMTRFGRAATFAARGLRMLSTAGLLFGAGTIVYDNWQPIEDFLNGLGLKVGHVADEWERLKTAMSGGDWQDIARWVGGRDGNGKVKDDWGLLGRLHDFLFPPAHGAESSPAGTISGAGGTVAQGQLGSPNSVAADAQALPSAVQAAMAQVQSIVAGVDLTAQGARIAQSLANGIRSGTGAIAAAARDAAQAAQVGSAMRGAYSDGGR